jgi:hypothetical protein
MKYLDDVFLQATEEPPLTVETPLDEYYVGEKIPWAVSAAATNGEIKIALSDGNRLVGEQTRQAAPSPLRGSFESRGLKPGISTLQAKTSAPPHTAQRQIILTQSPFDWPAP